MGRLKRLWRRLKRWRFSLRRPVASACPPQTAPPHPRFATAFDGPTLKYQLESLPDLVASLLFAFLGCTPSELSALVDCCEHPVLKEESLRHTRLRIPPDAARGDPLLRCLSSSTRTAPRPVRFAVADSHQLTQLLSIRESVQALTIDPSPYAEWPERPFAPAALRWFPNLVRLEIRNAGLLLLDLHALGLNAPKLQSLRIEEAVGLENDLRHCTHLRELWLANTNVGSLAIAAGLPALSALTLKARSNAEYGHWHLIIYGFESLDAVAALSRLVLVGDSYSPPQSSSWIATHLPTLKSYGSTNDRREWGHSLQPLCGAVRLRELRLGYNEVSDLEWLQDLPTLEKLQVAVSSTATHCRPLRRLENLKELWIRQGWLCDIVGYLPKLTRLVCEDSDDDSGRAILGRRRGLVDGVDDSQDAGCGRVSRLRELAIRGHVVIDYSDAIIQEMLESVVQFEVFAVRDFATTFALLRVAERLPRLDRLAIRDCPALSPYESSGFTSARSVTQVFLSCTVESSNSFPPWLPGATQLRVLACNLVITLANVPQLLTHLYLPHGRLTLHRMPYLRVLSLSRYVSCERFRRERGPGRLLPSLQSILHPTADCLWFNECCLVHRRWRQERREENPEALLFPPQEACGQLFIPPWGHDWEEFGSEPLL